MVTERGKIFGIFCRKKSAITAQQTVS